MILAHVVQEKNTKIAMGNKANQVDKTILIKKISELLESRLKIFQESLQENQKSINQAPTAWESHSDTLRFQFERYSDNLLMLIEQTKKAIQVLKTIKGKTDSISIGSLVKINQNKEFSYYFFTSMGLDESIITNGVKVQVVSVEAPFARNFNAKKVGDEVIINTPRKTYSVIIEQIS